MQLLTNGRKGQQSANLTAKERPRRRAPAVRSTQAGTSNALGKKRKRERWEGDEGAYGKVYASEGDAEALRNDENNDRSHRPAVQRRDGEVSVAQSRPLGLHLFTARPPPPTAHLKKGRWRGSSSTAKGSLISAGLQTAVPWWQPLECWTRPSSRHGWC